jgi:hypothetical protein
MRIPARDGRTIACEDDGTLHPFVWPMDEEQERKPKNGRDALCRVPNQKR